MKWDVYSVSRDFASIRLLNVIDAPHRSGIRVKEEEHGLTIAVPHAVGGRSEKALCKVIRVVRNTVETHNSRFWENTTRSVVADRIGTRPVDRQAAKELSHKRNKKRRLMGQ